MKVKELIELLKKEDPETKVVIDGYEGGYDEVTKLLKVCIVLNPDKQKDPDTYWYYGEYEECIADPNTQQDEIAIYLPRKQYYK